MPHIGYVVDGETYTFDQAIELAKRSGSFNNFPIAALHALRDTREDGGKFLSPSQANGCHRQAILKGEEDYYLNPEQQWAAFVGTAVHKRLETEDEYTEMFLSMDLWVPVTDPSGTEWDIELKLQGTVDSYDPELRTILDYKTVSEYRKYDPRLKRGADRTAADDDHVLQVNLYRMLLEVNGYPVDAAGIFYIQTYKEAKRNIFDVPLWDLDDTLELAVRLAEPLARYELLGELPPPLTEDHPKFWLCGRCPVAEKCRELAASGQ